MARRTFAVPSVDDEQLDAPVFEITYKRKRKLGGYVDELEEFTCLPELPADALRFLSGSDNTLAAMGFIARCIADDDAAARWWSLFSDRAILLRSEDIAAILEWLNEEYAERPTRRSSDSDGGPRTTGDTSTDG